MSKQDPKTTVRLYERTHDALLKLYGAPKTKAADRAVQALISVRSTALKTLAGCFSENEVKLLLDAHNSTIMEPSMMRKDVLKSTLLDAERFESLAGKWEIDLDDFLPKIEGYSEEQVFFLLDEIHRAWNGLYNEKDPVKALSKFFCHVK